LGSTAPPLALRHLLWRSLLPQPLPTRPSIPPHVRHRQWRGVGVAASAIVAAITATEAAAGIAARRRQRREARHQRCQAASGCASVVSAFRVHVAPLWHLLCRIFFGFSAPMLFVAIRACFNAREGTLSWWGCGRSKRRASRLLARWCRQQMLSERLAEAATVTVAARPKESGPPARRRKVLRSDADTCFSASSGTGTAGRAYRSLLPPPATVPPPRPTATHPPPLLASTLPSCSTRRY